MFAHEIETAGIYNVRTAIGLRLRNGKLPENIQPALRIMVEKVLGEAIKRGVGWEEVFGELVTVGELEAAFVMGGTDHPDPTLHSSPIAAERE